MKRKVFFLVVAAIMTAASGMAVSAQAQTQFWGNAFDADGKPAGAFCCVKETCVIAKNAEDCAKIGGEVVKNCADCEKKDQ